MKGLVLKSVGSWYDILSDDNIKYKGRLKGKFKIEDNKLTNPIAVGDLVMFEKDSLTDSQVVIDGISPRKNYIIRKSAHKSEHAHIIASNIDEAFLLATLIHPETSLGFIDRFLVAAESFRIPVSIIFNKMDLFSDKIVAYQKDLEHLYGRLGYRSFVISAEKEIGLEPLLNNIKGKKILISGHSGAGKSTLLNKIDPTLNIKTAAISNFANKGVHTTTFAEMIDMGSDTFLIDTPGIKEFGLFDISKNELSDYFPEMRAKIGQCKFHNCLHVNEPGCAVLHDIREGNIALSRYKSYLSILENEDNRR